MPAIGETLREARMRQGFDIADLEERTKIRAKYLRALENEEWAALPGHTFVKTFLRTYAEQVGLDPHMLVEEYRMSHESEEREFAPRAGPPAALRRDSRRDRRRPAPSSSARSGPPSKAPVIGLALLAVVAFIFVLGVVGRGVAGRVVLAEHAEHEDESHHAKQGEPDHRRLARRARPD